MTTTINDLRAWKTEGRRWVMLTAYDFPIYIVTVTWSDNSTDENGFTIEEWYRTSPGVWVLYQSVNRAANSTAASFSFLRRTRGDVKFRVKAFNASGNDMP